MKQEGLYLQISAAVIAQHSDKMLYKTQKSKDIRYRGKKKKTFKFVTRRSKINMGTFPGRRTCYGINVKLGRVTCVVFAETCRSQS